jgi:hypothetical protein
MQRNYLCIFLRDKKKQNKKPATKRASAPQCWPLRCLLQPDTSWLCLLPPPHSLMTFLKVAKESFGLPWKPGASKHQENSSPERPPHCSGSRTGCKDDRVVEGLGLRQRRYRGAWVPERVSRGPLWDNHYSLSFESHSEPNMAE